MTQRYHLVLPDELIEAVEQIATNKQTTAIEVLRKFIKIGLMAVEIEDRPGAALIVREEGKDEREISIFS